MMSWLVPFGASLLFLAGAVTPGEKWEQLLADHLARYPKAEAEDVYKFVHQSVFGPAHQVPDREEARRYLEGELASLLPGPPDEPLVDRLADDPPLVRLNLRPYRAGGGDVDRLLDAFVATAAAVRGDSKLMRRRLDIAMRLLAGIGRREAAGRLAGLARDAGLAGFPAGHHSDAYRAAYHPAYRVILVPGIPLR